MKLKKFSFKLVLLLLIISLAIFIRFINLDSNPPALYGDELTIGLDAKSLLQTGKDQTGKDFPLIFEMGAGRPLGYVYASIPFVGLFGGDPIGVRVVSALSGVFLVFLIFLIGRKLISENAGLFGAALMAISTWDISLSRVGFEAHFALLLSVLGIFLFLKGKENSWFYCLSALTFGLAVHTYPTYKLTLFLMIPLLIILTDKLSNILKNKLQISISILTFFLFAFLSLFQTFHFNSEERFLRINIFSDAEKNNLLIQKINEERSFNLLPVDVASLLHNKFVEYTILFIKSYSDNFSLNFLIFNGDGNPRHNVATFGAIYFAQIITLIIGLYWIFNKNKKVFLLIVSWILISPLPTAFLGVTHFLRSSFMLPPLILASGAGFTYLINYKWGKVLSVILFILILVQFLFFTEKLFFLTPNLYGNFWSTPAKQASEFAESKKSSFDYVILSDKIDNIEYAYPFYTNQKSIDVISQNKERAPLLDKVFKKFDNVYIGNLPAQDFDEFAKNLQGKVVFITSSTDKDNLGGYEGLEDLKGNKSLIFKTN